MCTQTVVKHCSGHGRLGPCSEQRSILAAADQTDAQPSVPAQHAADQPVSEAPEPQAPVTAMLEAGTATDGPAVKVEEQAQPLQPAGCSEHATKDATISSRLNESEALQYRHLMLKSLLYQRRGVRYIAVMATEQVTTRPVQHLPAHLLARNATGSAAPSW